MTARPPGWLTSAEAADRLGRSRGRVQAMVRAGQLTGRRIGRQLWVDPAPVAELADRRAADAEGWVTLVEAAELTDCSPANMWRLASIGEIVHRDVGRTRPCLSRGSVLEWAAHRHAVEEARAVKQRARNEAKGVSKDGHDWVGLTDAAEILGRSTAWVSSMAREERLPFTVHGGQRWFRVDHLQMRRAEWVAAEQAHRPSPLSRHGGAPR